MDQGPLVIDQIDAGETLLKHFDATFPVEVAFWLKGSESDKWVLYLASRAINETNWFLGYEEIRRLTQALPRLLIDPDQVKVVGTNNPIALAALELLKRYPTRLATRYRGPQLGGVGTDEVYIYPSNAVVMTS